MYLFIYQYYYLDSLTFITTYLSIRRGLPMLREACFLLIIQLKKAPWLGAKGFWVDHLVSFFTRIFFKEVRYKSFSSEEGKCNNGED